MVGKECQIECFDDPRVFFSPARGGRGMHLVRFRIYPLSVPRTIDIRIDRCREISFTFEICSETIYFNNNWPSDITVRVNGVELLTFTSPGDFGGRRGKYTPAYWPVTSTQFGLLKKIAVNNDGVFHGQCAHHKQDPFFRPQTVCE